MNKVLFLLLSFIHVVLFAQYAPPVGFEGTTAISKDSSIVRAWATGCTFQLGLLDIAQPNLGKPTIGDFSSTLGKAGTNGVLSLGDGGEAIVTFDYPISNGKGPDFAVFENGFNNTFLELAFVSVSSDGHHFVRFPAVSLSDTLLQYDNNAAMDATKLYNLAGKYRANFGTPFDLEELKDSVGLNIHAITHVKISDVVGSVNPLYAMRDFKNHIINDPYPTPYPSGGFDLDAVGVINSEALGIEERTMNVQMFPNPTKDILTVNSKGESNVKVLSIQGEELINQSFIDTLKVDLSAFPKGLYFVIVNGVGKKIVVE